MRKQEAKKYKVIPNPEYASAVKGFVPVFGSDQDLNLIDRIYEFNRKLESVDNEVMRKAVAERQPTKLSAKMKEVLRIEQQLTTQINSRNLDF